MQRLEFPFHTEPLLALVALLAALGPNAPFLLAALQGRDPAASATWGFALALVLLLACLNYLLLALLVWWRLGGRWMLALLIVASAVASHFIGRLGVVLDPGMIRNVLHTDPAEARELLSPALAVHLLLYAALPLALLSRVRLLPRPWLAALVWRGGTMLLALALLAGTLLAVYQPLSALLRNQHELRYRITPANLLWGLGALAAEGARGAAQPRQPIGEDAAPGPRMAARQRPLLVVVVVGETVRAANWGLAGYARQTTPMLAERGVIGFGRVDTCGTDTETSLPCMFAPVGRRDYDAGRIRGQQSLLHVLARAGVGVEWIDNQSGCKGVCDGLPTLQASTLAAPGLCEDGHCLDEALLAALPERLRDAKGTQLLVLHMLGNHGPSYFRRYPKDFARWQPACNDDDLGRCSREAIVNAYDNALLYTDSVLARLIDQLKARSGAVDSLLLFIPDHGESLGENGLFLHGLPYAIAPEVQKQVPMVLWLSDGVAAHEGLDADCLARRAREPAAHDHLFHTLLGLLDVKTALYENEWDLAGGCRRR